MANIKANVDNQNSKPHGTNSGSGIARKTSQNKETESHVRAQFASDENENNGKQPFTAQTSPLLSSTPPTVAKSLVKSYPYLLLLNKFLSVITWTNENYWINIVFLNVYALAVMYFEWLFTWCGHLMIVGIVAFYAHLNEVIKNETNVNPTLDNVVQALTVTSIKADMLLTPITSLALNTHDVRRLLLTAVFLTPIYLIFTFVCVGPRVIVLAAGLYLLTYHSPYSQVTRRMLWKLKFVRLLCFYLTGLDFLLGRASSFLPVLNKVQGNAANAWNIEGGTKPVRFTYVIYENQRRWLGIAWSPNLLSYERSPWTDEFLNQSASIDDFQLPNNEANSFLTDHPLGKPAKWRWIDKSWRLDLTNDGAFSVNNTKSKSTPSPNYDDGYVYYDNMWKKPSTEDSYSKYTRRRRWIRTAELVFENTPTKSGSTDDNEEKEDPDSKRRASVPQHGSAKEESSHAQLTSTDSAKEVASKKSLDSSDEAKQLKEELNTLESLEKSYDKKNE